MAERGALIADFVAGTEWRGAAMAPLAGDASARRYFRLARSARTAILMDAPPEAGQDVAPFVAMARALRGQGLSAPEILAEDRRRGFLLLEDLGDALFTREISADPGFEAPLYRAATDVLIALHHAPDPEGCPRADAATLGEMIAPAFEWYGARSRGHMQGAFEAISAEIVTVFAAVPLGHLSLRDFHADNMIWLPGRTGLARVGLLDFQDAMSGPLGYDLCSMLYDARRDVSGSVQAEMLARFADGVGAHAGDVAHAVAATAVQRNLRILGIFTRLALQAGKRRYLDLLPRVWGHVEEGLDKLGRTRLTEAVRGALPPPTDAILEDLRAACPTPPAP